MQNISNIFSDTTNLTLYSDQNPFTLSLRISSFETTQEELKFIKNCERLVRASLEYREWRNYIKDVLEFNSCFLTNESSEECTVEVHHHIPSLFMLIKAIVHKNIEEENSFSTFDICLEVMQIHYRNEIGYVCLVKTLHEKFHNGFLNIPVNLIQGNYQKFIDDYSSYLDSEDMEIIYNRLDKNLNPDITYIWSKNNYPNI